MTLEFSKGLKLSAQFPLVRQIRLLRNGVQVAVASGKDRAEFPGTEAGVDRLETWPTMDGEPRPWILTNPNYIH